MVAKAKKYRHLPQILLGVAVLLLVGGAFLLIRGIVGTAPAPAKKLVQEIHVIRPPPPPPDEPPPPPPPEEKVDIPDPQQQPDPTPSKEPPPGEQLGLDAEGTAGGDAFGLLGNKGGRELIGSGGGSVYAWYAGLVKGEILEQLSDDDELRKGNYKVTVQIWVRQDGSVDHARVVKSSGDPARDRAIESRAERVRFSKPPPAEVPQPMTIGVVGHG